MAEKKSNIAPLLSFFKPEKFFDIISGDLQDLCPEFSAVFYRKFGELVNELTEDGKTRVDDLIQDKYINKAGKKLEKMLDFFIENNNTIYNIEGSDETKIEKLKKAIETLKSIDFDTKELEEKMRKLSTKTISDYNSEKKEISLMLMNDIFEITKELDIIKSNAPNFELDELYSLEYLLKFCNSIDFVVYYLDKKEKMLIENNNWIKELRKLVM